MLLNCHLNNTVLSCASLPTENKKMQNLPRDVQLWLKWHIVRSGKSRGENVQYIRGDVARLQKTFVGQFYRCLKQRENNVTRVRKFGRGSKFI